MLEEFRSLNEVRLNRLAIVNKQEGRDKARQEKSDYIETENANATFQKVFDAQLDLIIQQLEAKKQNGQPHMRRVHEIWPEAENFRETAEFEILKKSEQNKEIVSEASKKLSLPQLISVGEVGEKLLLEDMTQHLRNELSQFQAQGKSMNQFDPLQDETNNQKNQDGGFDHTNLRTQSTTRPSDFLDAIEQKFKGANSLRTRE